MGFEAGRVDEVLAQVVGKEAALALLLPGGEGEEEFEDEEEDYKMIFVVRMDLKLQLCKIAECVATAALKAYQQMEAFVDVDDLKEFAFFEWNEGGQRKIVVKAPSEKDLLDLVAKA